MKLKIIIISSLILIVFIGGYLYFSGGEEISYDWTLAKKGELLQKVSATGQVIPAKKIDLQFEIQGRIKEIKVKVGDEVKTNETLVVLDTAELKTQVLEATAARDVYQAKLDQLLAGASQEDIKVYETAVENAEIALDNAQISLNNAEQNLTDVKVEAESDLNQAYEDALNVLDDSYLKLSNAFNTVDSIQSTYFSGYDQESLKVKESKNAIKEARDRAKSYLDIAKDDSQNENIDVALSEMRNALDTTSLKLVVIREMCDESVYRNAVSSSDKTSLDTQKSYIITALTNIVDSQQTISSAKLTNESDINTAQASLDTAQNAVTTAEGNLKSAEDKLAQIKASPREEDVALSQAQLNQAEAALSRAKQQLAKANLIVPIAGIITDIKKEIGETVTIGEPVILIISQEPFQIEADIPEADVGKVTYRDPVEITLDAFPDLKFSGKVIDIDPAETIIQGVVYYKVTIGFEKLDEKVKSGMTANIDVITESKENVLLIPQRAVLTRNGQKIVRVLEGEEIKEVKVGTGIRGSEGEIEILSGLNEGDKVITFMKKK